MPSTEGRPGTGPNGAFTVDDMRAALADQPGDATILTMDAHDADQCGVLIGVEPILNDVGRVLVYLVVHDLPEGSE